MYLLSHHLDYPSTVLTLCKLKEQSAYIWCSLLVWSVNIRTIWLNSISVSSVILKLKPLSRVSYNILYAHPTLIQTWDLFQKKMPQDIIFFVIKNAKLYIYNQLFFFFTSATRKISCLKSFALSETIWWVARMTHPGARLPRFQSQNHHFLDGDFTSLCCVTMPMSYINYISLHFSVPPFPYRESEDNNYTD